MSAPVIHSKLWQEFTRDEAFEMAKLRSDVFFLEQKITEEELDAYDRWPQTRHYWIEAPTGWAAYLRVVVDPDAAPAHRGAAHSIGRVVVRADQRGAGLARLMLDRAVRDHADLPLVLHSQVYIAGLYREFGFSEYGDPFDEAGIMHVKMFRPPAIPGTDPA